MSNEQLINDALEEIRNRVVREESIDIRGMVSCLGVDAQGLNKVRDLLIKHKQITRKDWGVLLNSVRKSSKYGRTPRDTEEYVKMWVAHHKVQARFNKTMVSDEPIMVDGECITEDSRKDVSIDNYARIMGNSDLAVDRLVRKLRLENDSMGFGFNNQSLQDAALEWFEDNTKMRRLAVFNTVSFAVGARNTDHWKTFCDAFDHSDHSAAFVEAVFRKFIWQVKRKMLGLPISDHLMPVVLGPQGAGKSTIIRERLLSPVSELTFDTNFDQVVDSRIIDMWEFNVLFLDEMGYATKTDVDAVKNVVTASFVPRRPMGYNTIKPQPQRAIFIGCSNKELDQLIRDETGVRRFVGVRFRHNPDREAINAIDYCTLWQSVDERGEDPMKPHMHELRTLQAASKATTPVEEWYTQYAPYPESWGKDIPSANLFSDFVEWCMGKYDKHADLGSFTREFNRVIKSDPASRWVNKRKKSGNAFVYN